MPYVPFFEYCPETAEKETRCISLLLDNNEYELPTGNYYFTENFCDECDCRRVFFNVFDEKKMVAVIYWGWETWIFTGNGMDSMTESLSGNYRVRL